MLFLQKNLALLALVLLAGGTVQAQDEDSQAPISSAPVAPFKLAPTSSPTKTPSPETPVPTSEPSSKPSSYYEPTTKPSSYYEPTTKPSSYYDPSPTSSPMESSDMDISDMDDSSSGDMDFSFDDKNVDEDVLAFKYFINDVIKAIGKLENCQHPRCLARRSRRLFRVFRRAHRNRLITREQLNIMAQIIELATKQIKHEFNGVN